MQIDKIFFLILVFLDMRLSFYLVVLFVFDSLIQFAFNSMNVNECETYNRMNLLLYTTFNSELIN